MYYTVSIQKQPSLFQQGDAVARLAVCVCDITFCCGKKALHQPADCAHCLPLSDFTA